MAHTWTPVSPVSTTGEATGADILTWAIIDPDYDTWNEILVANKETWNDWYTGTTYESIYKTITTPSATYQNITK